MNNSSSYQEEVVLTENGEVYNPIEIGITSFIIKIVCCSVGIPLNISIAVNLTRLRRLHRKPRNFFLLGIVLSYLSFFIFIFIIVNMLLALIDRYLAINHPLLHREKMTV
jgi:dopamine receptor D1